MAAESKLEPGREKTGGREKGTVNKSTAALKDMILGALDDVGGQAYLARQAEDNPSAFMALIGRVLPKDMTISADSSINIILHNPGE